MDEFPCLDEILDQPDADEPRLRAADRLEERGDGAWAEYIRLACRKDRLPGHSRERRALAARCGELLREHKERWVGPLPKGIDELSFERGLPARAWVDYDVVDGTSAEVFARWPIDRLEGDGEHAANPELTAFFQRPELERVRSLELPTDSYEPWILEAALKTDFTLGLEELHVGEDAEPGFVHLLLAERFPRLRRLAVAGYMAQDFGDEGAQALAGSGILAQIESLSLTNVALSPDGIEALVDSPGIRGLRTLQLSGGYYALNYVGPEGMRAIAASEHLAELEFLGVSFGRIGEEGIEALGKSRTLRRLQQLHAQAGEFSHDGFKHLGVSEVIDTIEVLDVSHNQLDARALHPLLVSVPPALRVLWLYGNPLGDAGVRALARSPLGDELLELNLASVGMGEEGARELRDSPSFQEVESLYCGLNHLDEEDQEGLRQRFGDALRSI